MKETFVLDASALIAFLNDEKGSDKVEDVLKEAKEDNCIIFMNKLNLLEIYYGVYREAGKEKAEDTLNKILNLPLIVVNEINDDVFREAGRLKAEYRISLADSIALAEARSRNARILTADHHEFDSLDKKGEVKFYWIR